MKLNLLFLLAVLWLFSCSNDKSASENTTTEENGTVSKDISELSYLEIYHLLFTNNDGGFDAHGDLYGQEAMSSVSFQEKADSCGNILMLNNQSIEDTVTVAVKANFNFPGNPTKEMTRAYAIEPSGQVFVGKSQLCYNDNTYTIQRSIISAGYTSK